MTTVLSLWRKWIGYPLGWLIIVAIALLIVTVSAGLGSKYPPMGLFAAEYTAKKVGDEVHLEVTETIRDVLERDRLGITRVLIPHYDGQDLGLDPEAITAVDPEGKDYPLKVNTLDNGDLELLIDRNDSDVDRRVHTRMPFTFIISYTLERPVIDAGDHQELYLNVNGTEWENGFDELSAELTIDPSLADHLTGDAACYYGRAGSTRECTITREDNTFSSTVSNIGAYQNMTIAVGLEQGTASNPLQPFEGRSHGWWGIAILVGIGAIPVLIALLVRRFTRRPSNKELGIVTQFTPPEDLPPVLAADFLGVPERGAAAHLAWLSTEGFAEIVSSEAAQAPAPPSRISRSSGGGLRVEWKNPEEGWPPAMRRITEALFGQLDRTVSLGHPRPDDSLVQAQEYRDDALTALGLRRPLEVAPYLLWASYLAIILYGLYQIWIGLDGLGWWFLLGGLVGVMLALWGFHLMPVHGRVTEKGRETLRHLAGLERFVQISEGERIRWMNSVETAPRDEQQRLDLYEKLLPWAIVFGAERSWRNVLGDMYSRFPERELQRPAWSVMTHTNVWADSYLDSNSRGRRSEMSRWSRRADVGKGPASEAGRSFLDGLGEIARGMASSSSSTRSSGRGWSGGGGSFRSGGGSSGGGRSGGGIGGGGGGRR